MRPTDQYLKRLRRELRVRAPGSVFDVDFDLIVAMVDELIERRRREIAN